MGQGSLAWAAHRPPRGAGAWLHPEHWDVPGRGVTCASGLQKLSRMPAGFQVVHPESRSTDCSRGQMSALRDVPSGGMREPNEVYWQVLLSDQHFQNSAHCSCLTTWHICTFDFSLSKKQVDSSQNAICLRRARFRQPVPLVVLVADS